MDALMLIPRLPAFLLVALFAVAALVLWRWYRTYTRHLWGGEYYFANRLAVVALVVLCMYHPSLRYECSFDEKKVLAIAWDTSLSMNVTDAGENVTRGQAERAILSDPEFTDWLEDRFDVRWYAFDTSARVMRSPDEWTTDEDGGSLTAIRSALDQISSRISPEILAGIVLLSDGVETGDAAVDYLPPVPVYTIGVGSTAPAPVIDREVRTPIVPRKITVNSRAELSITVQCLGQEHQPVPLTLSLSSEDGSNAVTVASVTAAFAASGESRLCAMSFIPNATGRFRLTAAVPVREDEILQENNERVVYIDIVDPEIPVLYLEGKPRFEFKFFKRALESDEFILPTSIVKIGPDRFLAQIGAETASQETARLPGDLSAFKVIVLGDIVPQVLGENWLGKLTKFVEDGGGLLFLGSQGMFGSNASTPFYALLLPYQSDNAPVRFYAGDFTLSTSRQGRVHPLFGESLQRMDEPVVSGAFSFPAIKSGASVLAYLKRDSFRTPGVLVQRYGRGRVALTAMEAAWPWELRRGAMGDRTTYFNQLWRQTVRWLAGLEETETEIGEPLIVRTDCYDYYAGESVRMSAFVSCDAFERPPSLTGQFDESSDERFSFTQDRSSSGSSYRYTAEYPTERAGKYTLHVRAEDPNPNDANQSEPLERTVNFIVKRSAREWERCGLNEGYLKNLARRTGGRYYPIERVRDLHQDLPIEQNNRTRLVEREIWNHPLLLALIFLLLSAEWGIRRRYERLKPEDFR